MLRCIIAMVLTLALSHINVLELAAAPDGYFGAGHYGYSDTLFAQQGYGSGSGTRMLAPPNWQAAQAARSCAPGGTMIKFESTGNGYSATFDFGNRVVVVRVDANGRCYR